jgi:signal transduction histidine kinase
MRESHLQPVKRNLRNKVFSLLFIYALVLVSFFGFSMIIIAYVIEDEVINQRLLLEAKYLQLEYETNQNIKPRGKHFELYFSFNELPEDLKDQVYDKNYEREIVAENQKNYHYYHFYIALEQEAFLVVDVSDISLLDSISRDLFIVLIVFIIFTLILSIGLTLLISKKVISPLIKLTDAIKSSEFAIPILPKELLSRDDELGYLTNSLQNSFNDLAYAIERESEFTQDVSHELRTPIAVMLNTFTLVQDKPLSLVKQSVLEQQVKLMNNRVQILLALARAESIEKQTVSLLSVVEESILSIHKIVEDSGFKITLDIPMSTKVAANEHLITLMFANLIENAIKYSSNSEMLIQSSATGISISNQTNLQVTEELMKKSYKAPESEGFGQGLFLVTRILKSTGWSFKLLPSETQFKLSILF